LPSARRPIQRQPRATIPSGNDPWTFTHSQKTGSIQRGSRPRSAASSASVSSTSPMSSGRGDQTDDPTPSTQPAITMRPASERAGRVRRQAIAASTPVSAAMSRRRPTTPNQESTQP